MATRKLPDDQAILQPLAGMSHTGLIDISDLRAAHAARGAGSRQIPGRSHGRSELRELGCLQRRARRPRNRALQGIQPGAMGATRTWQNPSREGAPWGRAVRLGRRRSWASTQRGSGHGRWRGDGAPAKEKQGHAIRKKGDELGAELEEVAAARRSGARADRTSSMPGPRTHGGSRWGELQQGATTSAGKRMRAAGAMANRS
jgi:hypothetical protein